MECSLDKEIESSAFEKPACPFRGNNANERFDLNLKDDECALIPFNSGSNKCVYCPPYKKRITEYLGKGYGCDINTEENKLRLVKCLEETKKERKLEKEMKKYGVKINILPPGIAEGAIETIVDRAGLKLTPYGVAKRNPKS